METAMGMQTWHAAITYLTDDVAPTEDEYSALVTALPGYGIAVHKGPRIRLEMTVEATTARKAVDDALKAAQTAWAAAFDVVGVVVGVEVMTEHDYLHPQQQDLVGVAEIVDLGEFNSRQAAHKATSHPNFPTPVAELKMGNVYSTPSVREFLKTWPRVKGWAGRHGATPNK